MHDLSHTQKAYLARQKRTCRLVVSARLLVFLDFSGTMGNPGKDWAGSILLSSAALP